MKRSAYARAALAIGAIALACTSALAQTAQQPAKFRIQTAVPSASIYFELLKRFGDRVDRMSGGRIKMEMLPDGAIAAVLRGDLCIHVGVVGDIDGRLAVLETNPNSGPRWLYLRQFEATYLKVIYYRDQRISQ